MIYICLYLVKSLEPYSEASITDKLLKVKKSVERYFNVLKNFLSQLFKKVFNSKNPLVLVAIPAFSNSI